MARDWRVESLRLTLFSSETLTVSDADWSAITGQPEAETRQKLPGGSRYIGNFAAGGQLTVEAVRQRLDVSLMWAPSGQQTDSPEFPVIGAWDQIRDTFISSTKRWLEVVKFPIVRIAFAGVLLSETTDVTDSYRALKELLRSVAVDIQMRELIFRVNWPEKSVVLNDLTLNRITNWSAIQIGSTIFQMAGAAITAETLPAEKFAIRLEFDHNTSQENKTPFPQDKTVPIYEELIVKSCENVVAGERP
jgi:hypothetical protein